MEITNTNQITSSYYNPYKDENTSEELISKNLALEEEKDNLKSTESKKESKNQEEKAAFDIKIADKSLMDLKDMQKFLFMMIGSDIKIESESAERGSNVNILS